MSKIYNLRDHQPVTPKPKPIKIPGIGDIHKRYGTNNWQARVKEQGGKWFRFSTGIDDPTAAQEIARQKFYELKFRVELKLPAKLHLFNDWGDKWIEYFKQLVADGKRQGW